MALDTKSNSLDDAREYIKALASWIKDDQIEYDSEMNPVGVSGAKTPFTPFHWKCRTTTELLISLSRWLSYECQLSSADVSTIYNQIDKV